MDCRTYSTNYDYCGLFGIDVNGEKPPNTWGRDYFRIYIANKGVFFAGSRQYSQMITGDDSSYSWENRSTWCGTKGSTDVSSAYGLGCTARIRDEGWVMDY